MDPKAVAGIIADALRATCVSPNELDRNLEPANVVDGLFAIARALEHVAVALQERDRDRSTGGTREEG